VNESKTKGTGMATNNKSIIERLGDLEKNFKERFVDRTGGASPEDIERLGELITAITSQIPNLVKHIGFNSDRIDFLAAQLGGADWPEALTSPAAPTAEPTNGTGNPQPPVNASDTLLRPKTAAQKDKAREVALRIPRLRASQQLLLGQIDGVRTYAQIAVALGATEQSIRNRCGALRKMDIVSIKKSIGATDHPPRRLDMHLPYPPPYRPSEATIAERFATWLPKLREHVDQIFLGSEWMYQTAVLTKLRRINGSALSTDTASKRVFDQLVREGLLESKPGRARGQIMYRKKPVRG